MVDGRQIRQLGGGAGTPCARGQGKCRRCSSRRPGGTHAASDWKHASEDGRYYNSVILSEGRRPSSKDPIERLVTRQPL
jgi:hypothetical protein